MDGREKAAAKVWQENDEQQAFHAGQTMLSDWQPQYHY
jgi:hypothetical protein